ncbi:hypothetical protein P4493_05025 [Bacillus thuringiensis]|uniref:Uncharacterized protein n=4 Tax=Bacillus thuringiensis TaxID=1428 RepID=A0A0B5NK70_BACTU|nr:MULTISPECIES: hypothetical protein [Bacillus]MEC2535612.1 hypothetical protein [Bacillus cereus]MED1153643.1 hypothetical protein [Bacillus paranthracis]OUB09473.1 hypothetical protein BK708_33705 [Bacillus thuringiensis serovar yunnanensis]AFQ29966.1 hypothetical protein BTF1_29327 [Bacillus thuringiensis HD-789]AJG73817.1 hypothetical protein BF38_5756 [Bacillus thuringiensis]
MLFTFVIHLEGSKQRGLVKSFDFTIQAESYAKKLISEKAETIKVEIFQYVDSSFILIDSVYNVEKE